MTLLNRTLALMPEDSARHIALTANVPDGLRALRIEFSYEPKHMTDEAEGLRVLTEGARRYVPEDERAAYGDPRTWLPLSNLLSLSVDAPDGYRGCAHRHDPVQTFILGEQSASYGFEPGRVTPGTWRFVISTHAVVSSPCTARLEVTGE